MAPIPGYNVRKAAQVVAYFAQRSGGTINVLKLIKLVYLAERTFIGKYDFPMLWDRLVSMPQGPVPSDTLNFVNGEYGDNEDWDSLISDREEHLVGLRNAQITEDDLDELSDAEIEVLGEVWGQFGRMDRFALVKYTHDNCPEWEDPHGSSSPIPYQRILRYLGKPHASDTAHEIESLRNLDAAIARAQ
ncbi:Panacea domain-containing protein [Dongia sp.]|uniref:Panacea domain-containing protein n=1 Tax=Dongia sp. TaxID=1977262 RepID=UPI003751D0AF